MSSSASVPRLIYFNSRGRAELTRLMFAYASLPYEDVRLSREEFGALKPTLPAGQVPVLQINGEYFPQSKAIEQYVARKAGLYPIDTEQAFIVDIVREHLADATGALAPVIYGPEEKRAEARAQFLTTTFPTVVERLNKILVAHGGVFFTGVGTTYADIAAFHFLDALSGLGSDAEEAVSKAGPLAELKSRVAAIPNIAKYLSTRA